MPNHKQTQRKLDLTPWESKKLLIEPCFSELNDCANAPFVNTETYVYNPQTIINYTQCMILSMLNSSL